MKQNTNKVIDTDNPELTEQDFKGMKPISELLNKLAVSKKTDKPKKQTHQQLHTA